MRKHNEGYSLVLVLVVLVVICLVATFILSFSLSNLKNQQASVERMQHRYAVAGEIEKIVAELEKKVDPVSQTIELKDAEVDHEKMTVKYVKQSGTVRIECTLLLEAEMMEPVLGEEKYFISGWTGVKCISYQISTIENDGEVTG